MGLIKGAPSRGLAVLIALCDEDEEGTWYDVACGVGTLTEVAYEDFASMVKLRIVEIEKTV